ncbi:MAG TPA: hypothetical protein VHT00_21120 [Stellaceae bacterium]|nr:hypothetical protein [Stellaceae bacterium]
MADGNRTQHPAVVVQPLHPHHLEILVLVRRWRAGVGLVEGVGEAHVLDRLLRDAVNHHRCWGCR